MPIYVSQGEGQRDAACRLKRASTRRTKRPAGTHPFGLYVRGLHVSSFIRGPAGKKHAKFLVAAY